MAVRPSAVVGRLALERALARMPDVVPESVELVELVRGHPYVVVRHSPAGVVVLDERGRLVRSRIRLAAIARHLDTTSRVRAVLEQTLLDRRRAHLEQSLALLERERSGQRRTSLRASLSALLGELENLRVALDGLEQDLRRQQGVQPTERTLRRTVTLLNEAARADRRVVLATRRLAAALLARGVPSECVGTLRRWVAARLASSDLPLFYAELDEPEGRLAVESFVAAARA
jgi:hypothetical protein